jgi:ubiquinone/menaquinone biosynthesis C-methylase UbiE
MPGLSCLLARRMANLRHATAGHHPQGAQQLPEFRDLGVRLAALLDHLGLQAAHFATQMPGDLAALAQGTPQRIAGVVFAVPVRLDPAAFQAIASRVAIITGDSGVSIPVSQAACKRLAGATLIELRNYLTTGWSDVARDRPDELATAMIEHLGRGFTPDAEGPARSVPRHGQHAGISYRIEGSGPALVLMPFFLAASQWAPITARLAERFSVITVGGAHIGGVAILEERAGAPTYQAMFRTLVDFLAPPKEAHVLDVGCGSGALGRQLVGRLRRDVRLTSVDLNAYLLGEAKALAQSEGLAEAMTFVRASAEHLPFADSTFDCAFSVTVLEECDADRAIGELKRVVRPGGSIGIVVRAIDLPQWWNVDIPGELAAKVNIPPQSIGPRGVADRSLYARMLSAGLTGLRAFPSLLTLDTPGNSVWRYREDHLLGTLTPAEIETWIAAREAARAAGVLMQANPMHCAVARKPE